MTSHCATLVVAAVILIGAPAAGAASFDCRKASTPVEKMICGTSELSALDEELSRSYRRAFEGSDESPRLRQQQRAWIRDVRDRCTTEICADAAMHQRIKELDIFLWGPTGVPPKGMAESLEAATLPLRPKQDARSGSTPTGAAPTPSVSAPFARPSPSITSALLHSPPAPSNSDESTKALLQLGQNAAAAAAVLNRDAEELRQQAARTDIDNFVNALKLYRLDHLRYPLQEQGLEALVREPRSLPVPSNWRPFLDRLPKDPWGHPYQYLNPGVKGQIDIFSFGADGRPGGRGKDADIGSWE